MTNPNDQTDQLQRAYQRGLREFCQHYGALREAGKLTERQTYWVEAAAEATQTLNLTPTQLKAVLRVPEAVTVNQPAALAALPDATEAFYRMELLANVARQLTEAIPGGRPSAWISQKHLSGTYQEQSPLEAVTRGPSHELYRLRGTLNFYGGL